MKPRNWIALLAFFPPLLFVPTLFAQSELNFQLSGEARRFLEDPLEVSQPQDQVSVALEAEYYVDWNNGRTSFTFTPFFRIDSEDDERQHGDIRELLWIHAAGDWEFQAGAGKVFWGVTESQHLVDVINQTDQVEAIDGEDKLGQPMLKLGVSKDWGALDLFVLPYFRERTFGSLDGRLVPQVAIDTDDPRYESDDEEQNIDYAVRWSHSIGDWDIGVSYFDGTAREPILEPVVVDEELVLKPYYAQMQQWGVDIQAIVGNTLWKFEAINRDSQPETFTAVTAGFEHTLVGIFDTSAELGLLAEYQWDERDELATTPGQNDLFVGARIAFNNAQSTEILLGFSQDLEHQDSRSGMIEASHRISDNVTVSLDAWFFQSEEPQDLSYSLRQDDFVQLNVSFYF